MHYALYIPSITKQHNSNTSIHPSKLNKSKTNLSRESLDGLLQLTTNLLRSLSEFLGLLTRDLRRKGLLDLAQGALEALQAVADGLGQAGLLELGFLFSLARFPQTAWQMSGHTFSTKCCRALSA